MRVADLPDDETLDALGIDDPLDLTGLYEGVDLTRQSASDPDAAPARVWLYRLPILAEWAERGETPLGDLVTHVLVHELGHHFGFSDAEMHAIEEAGED